jgi:hypothetical protein
MMVQDEVLQCIDTLDWVSVTIVGWQEPRVLLSEKCARTGRVPDVDLIVGIELATEFRSSRDRSGYLTRGILLSWKVDA